MQILLQCQHRMWRAVISVMFSVNYRTVHCCEDQFDAHVTAVKYLHEIDLTLVTKLWLLS